MDATEVYRSMRFAYNALNLTNNSFINISVMFSLRRILSIFFLQFTVILRMFSISSQKNIKYIGFKIGNKYFNYGLFLKYIYVTENSKTL